MLVKDVMTKKVMTVSPDTSIKDAARLLADNHIGSLIVMEEKSVIGIITERNILNALAESEGNEIDSKIVNDAMTSYIISITPTSSVQDAVKIMAENKIKKLPVMDGATLIGIITASDIITNQPRLIKGIKSLWLSGRRADKENVAFLFSTIRAFFQ